jgi:hypothetical protein
MRPVTLLVVLFAALLSACAGEQFPFEDRSDEVRIEHRIPSK